MPLIRANRESVNDRFSVVGFTVRTESPLFEVGVATDPQLFRTENRSRRSRRNFHSSRAAGVARARRGEAVYLVPPDVLANFIGQPKLYFGLATYRENSGGVPDWVQAPTEGHMYVDLSGLTERGLRRLAGRPNAAGAYGATNGHDPSLDWGGDAQAPVAAPATNGKAVAPANGTPGTAAPAAPAAAPSQPYDDGFGAFPATQAAPADAGAAAAKPAVAQSYRPARALDEGDETYGIEGPIPDDDEATAQAQSLRSRGLDTPAPEYPGASRFAPAHPSNYRAVQAPRQIDKVVIHITDGGSRITGTIGWFQNPNQRNARNQPIHVSAHYVVGRDGEVVQMVRHNDVAWHAGRANSHSIGIEHVANTRGLVPTEEEYRGSAALVAWLCNCFSLPIDRTHILGHAEADPHTTHTVCPNAVWDWDHYMDLVREASAGPGAVGTEPAPAAQSLGRSASYARAQEIIEPFYDQSNPMSALTCQDNAFSLAREEWFMGVADTTQFPHSAICQLNMTGPDGSLYGGTGFYIGANRILTCAHNLDGMSSVTIIPGRNGTRKPFGECTVQSSSWRISRPPYTGDGNWENDLAVIDNVPLAAPNRQWFGFLNATPSEQLPIVVCGYAAASRRIPELTQAIDGDKQHLHGGYATSQSNGEVIEYPILALQGNSGSPVYHLTNRSGALQAMVCAVHVTGEPAAQGLNRGCFITPNKIDWIESRATAFALGSSQPARGRQTGRVRTAPQRAPVKALTADAFTWPAAMAPASYLVADFIEVFNARIVAGVTWAAAPDPRQYDGAANSADATARRETLSRSIARIAGELRSDSGRQEVGRAILQLTTAVSMQVLDEIHGRLPKSLYQVVLVGDPLPAQGGDLVLPRNLTYLSRRIGMFMAWLDIAIQQATSDTAARLNAQKEQWDAMIGMVDAGATVFGLVPGAGEAATVIGLAVHAILQAEAPKFEHEYASFDAAMREIRRSYTALPAAVLRGLIASALGEKFNLDEALIHPDVRAYLDAHSAYSLQGWEEELAFLGFAAAGVRAQAAALQARRQQQPVTRARALIIGPEEVEQAQRYAPRWADLFNWSVPDWIHGYLAGRDMSVQRIADAAGALNLDRYEVRVTAVPGGYTDVSLLDYVRMHINEFLDTDNSEFIPYTMGDDDVKWISGSPVGAVFKIDIVGPDNAAVVASLVEQRRWRFTTVHTTWSGDHPVSGHREFGVRAEADGAVVVYTRGADRATDGLGESIAFFGADHLWRSFQRKLVEWIAANGGSATALAPFSERFHPKVVDILYGQSTVAQSLAARRPAASRSARALGAETIEYPVQLVPQPNKLACWAASMAMLLSFRHNASYEPETLANEVGGSVMSTYGWDLLQAVRDRYGFTAIDVPSNTSLYYSVSQWAQWLRDLGPLWVVIVGMPHAVVVSGLRGDTDNPESCEIKLLNPWDTRVAFDNDPVDFHPANAGYADWLPFRQFASDFGNMAAPDYGNWRVLHLPAQAAAAAPSTTAQALSVRARSRGLAAPPKPVRAFGLDTAVPPDEPIEPSRVIGTTMRRCRGNRARVTWALDQLDGVKVPDPAAAIVPALIPTTITLDRWPCVGSDATPLPLTVCFDAGGGAVGNVRITAGSAAELPYDVNVTATIADASGALPGTNPHAALRVTIDYDFTGTPGGDASARIALRLVGNGRYDMDSNWQ